MRRRVDWLLAACWAMWATEVALLVWTDPRVQRWLVDRAVRRRGESARMGGHIKDVVTVERDEDGRRADEA